MAADVSFGSRYGFTVPSKISLVLLQIENSLGRTFRNHVREKAQWPDYRQSACDVHTHREVLLVS